MFYRRAAVHRLDHRLQLRAKLVATWPRYSHVVPCGRGGGRDSTMLASSEPYHLHLKHLKARKATEFSLNAGL